MIIERAYFLTIASYRVVKAPIEVPARMPLYPPYKAALILATYSRSTSPPKVTSCPKMTKVNNALAMLNVSGSNE